MPHPTHLRRSLAAPSLVSCGWIDGDCIREHHATMLGATHRAGESQQAQESERLHFLSGVYFGFFVSSDRALELSASVSVVTCFGTTKRRLEREQGGGENAACRTAVTPFKKRRECPTPAVDPARSCHRLQAGRLRGEGRVTRDGLDDDRLVSGEVAVAYTGYGAWGGEEIAAPRAVCAASPRRGRGEAARSSPWGLHTRTRPRDGRP